MSFDWSQYLLVAQELAGQKAAPSSQEAKLRAAVSRAYYAVFCKASNHLRDKEGLPITQRRYQKHDHGVVIREFENGRDAMRKQIGQDLRRLHGDRTRVDYHDNAGITANQVVLDLALAELLIANVDSL